MTATKRINIGNDKAYFEYDVIVDGEVTTAMINDGDENELEEGKLYNKIKTNSDEYITGGDEIGYDTDEASGTDLKSSTDPIKHSNGTLQLGGKKWIVASDAEIYGRGRRGRQQGPAEGCGRRLRDLSEDQRQLLGRLPERL